MDPDRELRLRTRIDTLLDEREALQAELVRQVDDLEVIIARQRRYIDLLEEQALESEKTLRAAIGRKESREHWRARAEGAEWKVKELERRVDALKARLRADGTIPMRPWTK